MWRDPFRLILLAPLAFAAHVAEEAPGFVAWFNSLAGPPISRATFLQVNAAGGAITVLVCLVTALRRDQAGAVLATAWLSFLMLANGALHLVATMVHGRYCPGVITGCLLYLPYASWLLVLWGRRFREAAPRLWLAAALGALPMLWHGYLIVFRGGRLF